MTRNELASQLARRTGMPVEAARRALEAIFGTSSEAGLLAAALCQGDRLQLAGFGTFEMRQRKERTGRNPLTREVLLIPASRLPVFRPAAALRARCAAQGCETPGAAGAASRA